MLLGDHEGLPSSDAQSLMFSSASLSWVDFGAGDAGWPGLFASDEAPSCVFPEVCFVLLDFFFSPVAAFPVVGGMLAVGYDSQGML